MTETHTFRMPFWHLLFAMLVVGQAFDWALLGITTLVDVTAFGSTFFAGGSIGAAVITSLFENPRLLGRKAGQQDFD